MMTTDQGKEFNNEKLMKALNIQHRLTTPYHPQANGLVERFNQTLINSLAKFVQDNREGWDENLDAVVYGYNTAVQVRDNASILIRFTLFYARIQQKFLPSKQCLVE